MVVWFLSNGSVVQYLFSLYNIDMKTYSGNITKNKLIDFYFSQKKSVPEIAKKLNCSENKINYWLRKNDIRKRSISEAIYIKNNPKGDPFEFNLPKNVEEARLFGMGLGLYWGEGTKANKTAVRLGNSDATLLNTFIKFLVTFFQIRKKDLRFHLHVFTDISLNEAYEYWTKKLKVSKEQFYKPIITKTGKLGTYRNKSKYGVVTVYYCNKKLRDLLMDNLPL
jgi:hypothetical protein